MIEADIRKAIYLLHQEGMPYRKIARDLGVSRNTVRQIVAQQGLMPVIHRKKQRIDEDLLRRLYHQCHGYRQRVYEKLIEEHGIEVTYPTLTRMLRELGISTSRKQRCDLVPDEPGLDDLNQQALQWSTVRLDNRPQGKAGLIPAKAFEYERHYLIQLPVHLPAPYRTVMRGTDQYGYIAFEGNYYYVPGSRRDQVKVLVYSDRLKLYQSPEYLIEYPLPPEAVKNKLFSPPGQPRPRYHPNNRRRPTQQEEKRLRSLSASVSAYLDFALKPKGIERHQFLRKLYGLMGKMTESLFIAAIERAHKYKITDMATIERIAALQITEDVEALPRADVDEDFHLRDAYLQGRLTDPPELWKYDEPIQEDDHA